MRKINPTPASGRRAFTVLEVVVAIGAVAVVTVGLASVFQSVGKAVSGGQRVSSLSQYAASIEQQMRRDFSRMTRDGFLVIRNQRVTNQNAALYKGDPNPRPRRVDELMFFAKGEFKSLRDSVNPYVSVSSNQARIYYGHGAKPEYSGATTIQAYEKIARPELWTRNSPMTDSKRLGDNINVSIPSAKPYANAFASEWTLLRHVTLLVAPENTRINLPKIGWGAVTAYSIANMYSRAADKDCQIGLRPAVSSIFQQVAAIGPTEDADGRNAVYLRNINQNTEYPKFASGIIDIATTSLAEIRTMVNFNPKFPSEVDAKSVPLPVYSQASQYAFTPGQDRADHMHAWMANALPTNSDQHNFTGTKTAGNGSIVGQSYDPHAGTRMRYDVTPPDELGIIADPQLQTRPEELQYRLADQRMLSASNFVPRCSEFIVEWTFGLQDTNDLNGDGDKDELEWYGTSKKGTATKGIPQMTVYGQSQKLNIPLGGTTTHTVAPGVIYGSGTLDPSKIVTACFGYVDPTYPPSTVTATAPRSIPAAWPKAVRITMRLADANDPSLEETFSFVFPVPDADPIY